MDVREIIGIIQRQFWLVVAILFVAVGSTWYASVKKPKKFEAGISVTVIRRNPVPQKTASFYQYDNFYALQASGLFTDTLSQWATSPAVVVEVFQKAQVPWPAGNLRGFAKVFRPRKQVQTANVVDISTINENKDQALSLVNGLSGLIEEKSNELFGQDPGSVFYLSISQPVVVEQKTPLTFNVAVAAILGLGVGIMAAFGTAAAGGARSESS